MKGTVLSVIKNNLGIYGFIKSENKKYYYNTSGLTPGIFMKKGLVVEFDVIMLDDGRDKAINIRTLSAYAYKEGSTLTDLQIKEISLAIGDAIGDNGFVAAATIPFVLKRVGVDNFREYAGSIEEFINKYFSEEYEYIRNFVKNEKRYPGIVAKLKWENEELSQSKALDSEKHLSVESINAISERIQEICDTDGFLLSSAFPVMLRNFGISNYKIYADSVELFLRRFFSGEFVVLKDVFVLGKRYPGIIVSAEKKNDYEYEQDENDVSIEEHLSSIDYLIEDAIQTNGFLLLSVIPSMLNELGIDYHKYATNLIDFIKKYFFGKYNIKQNYWINGKILPNVLVMSDAENSVNESVEHDGSELVDYSLLDNLYDEKKYIEFLRSLQLTGVFLDKIPDVYLEKIFSCADQLLFSNETEFTLNLFQRELLYSRTGRDFIKKWKKPNGYPSTILVNFEKSSLCHLSTSDDVGIITKLINDAGSDTKVNNSFVSLTSRFEACRDSLTHLLYIIRACSAVSLKNIEKTIGEYCAFLKGLKADNISQRVNFSEVLTIFEKYLDIIVNCVIDEPISKESCTNVLSVYLDLNYQERIPQILELMCKDKDNPLLIFLDFLSNYETWNTEKYSALFSNGISLRIIEKICAFIWEKASNHLQLDEAILKMLAQVLLYGGNNILDEIMRLHISQDYTKKQKEFALVNSFRFVIERLYTDDSWFMLSSYIKEYIYENICDDNINNIDPLSMNEINDWKETVDSFFSDKLERLGNLSKENEEEYLELLHLFICEGEKAQLLQKKYNDWYGNLHGWYINSSQEQMELFLDEVYTKKVDYSFTFIYEYAEENGLHISSKYARMYLESLLRMHMFDKVIRFTNTSEILTNDEKEETIIQTVCDNFKRYGLTEEAFLIFTEEFSINEAIAVLEKNIFPNRFSQIISLIILYAKNNELIKSVYLYTIYHGHAETGFTRIYSQYRSNYGRHFAKLHDHYEVVLKAFEALPYKQLLDFIRWTSSIAIPSFAEYNPRRNTFSFFSDELIKNPGDLSVWKRFISHLYSHREIEANQWLLCVSVIMARYEFNVPSLGEVHNIFISVLNAENKDRWPENLLYYAARYIVDNEDEILCEKVYSALLISNIADKMLYENPWCDMATQLDFFVDFCVTKLRETSDLVYFNLLTVIKKDLSGSDLVELSSFSVNKVYLLNKICMYYIENKNQGESIALLSNIDIWRNLTFQESELYNAVKLLYMSTEEIVENCKKIFLHEEDVERFKRDLATVLVEYPSQESLHDFDKTCINDAHKLRIYSIIYGIYGIEEIYNKYQYDFDEIMSKGIEYEYLAFLKKCFVSQIFYNSTYEYIYKLWRYLRLLIIDCWDENNQQDSEEIIDVMNKYQHYDMVMRLGYAEFKDILYQFVADKSISMFKRKCILYCLLKEDFGALCKKHACILSDINENTKKLIGKMTAFLDFRDINEKLFRNFDEELCSGKLNETYELTNYLSLSFSNLLDVMSHSKDYREDVLIVKKFMLGSAAACVNNIISLDDEMYGSKEQLYVSIMGARQLAFKIFNRIRELLIKQRIQFSAERYKGLAKCLERLGYSSAISQFHHILALEYALKGAVDSLRSIVSTKDAFIGIPVEWESENEKLIQYSQTECTEKFEPVFSIAYIGAGQSKKGRITFADELCKFFKLDLVDRKNEEIILELYQEYYESEADIREKTIAGLKLLQVTGKQRFDKRHDDWPDYYEFAFDVGNLIASKESFVTSDIKIFVLEDLYQNGGLTGLQRQTVYERFMSFYKELSIDQWIKNYDFISDIVRSSGDNDGAEEIAGLCNSINKSVPGLSDTEKYSSEELYDQLISVNYIGQSIYSVAVARAVERKKDQIENAVRLSIEIENEEVNGNRVVNDGYVYLCVKNIGNISLNIFEDSEIELYLNSTDGTQYTPLFAEISGIKELRPNWLTGCRVDISKICELRKSGELLKAHVRIHVNGVLVCSKMEALIITDSILLEEIPEPVRNGYYVRLAVGDNEDNHKLYGRSDEKEDIKYAISTGKAVIYGPSRIGKTSLLNWIIHSYAKEKKNVISILVGGEEGNGKENDYEKNIKDKSTLLYDNNTSITEYLFVDMLISGLNSINILNPRRRRAIFPNEIEQGDGDILVKIIETLNQRNRAIVDRYYDVDFILQSGGYEIWLLFDEFQQVVEKWNMVEVEEPDEFIEVCDCINERSITSTTNIN